VPEDLIRKLILEAGIWAPTGSNAQTWRFVAVTDPNLVRKMKMIAPGILGGNPPVVIAVCQDFEESERKYIAEVIRLMDTAVAAQNILLAAYDQGLGTCLIASFHPGAVQEILHLPPSIVPQLLISLGYPQAKPQAPKRNTKLVWFNEYPPKE
jgi:nitroreductase